MLNSRRLRENNFLTLDSYYRYSFPTQMFKASLAIVAGIACGLLLSAGEQKLLNKMETARCSDAPGHQLVSLTSFVGDAKYCLPRYATGSFTAH